MKLTFNTTEHSISDQYRLRLLQAKAEFLRQRPGVNVEHAPYATIICEYYKKLDPNRVRKVLSMQIRDYSILKKLEAINEACKNG